MKFDWRQRRVIVTGATRGFGLVLAKTLVAAGAEVLICGRDETRLQSALEQLRNGSNRAEGPDFVATKLVRPDQLHGVTADVTTAAGVETLMASLPQNWDRLDGLFCIVGRSSRGTLESATVETFRRSLEDNFLSAVACTQAALPKLLASQGQLVLMGSLAAKSAGKYMGAYAASKFPLAAYAQQLRQEMGPRGLRVLLVCPGPIAGQGEQASRLTEESPRHQADPTIPAAAAGPGGGVKLRVIDPDWLAPRILLACERGERELVVPAKARWLFALQQLSATWGDWLSARYQPKSG